MDFAEFWGGWGGDHQWMYFVNASFQVNETVDVLHLFEISKLCDGTSQCWQGSDENNPRLKCTSEYQYYNIVILIAELTFLNDTMNSMNQFKMRLEHANSFFCNILGKQTFCKWIETKWYIFSSDVMIFGSCTFPFNHHGPMHKRYFLSNEPECFFPHFFSASQ